MGGDGKRKGPEAHASETDIGTIKIGNDAKYWVVVGTATGQRRWVPLSPTKPKVYHPFMNGDSSQVVVGESKLMVFKDAQVVFSLASYQRLWLPRPRFYPKAGKGTPPKHAALLVEKSPKNYLYINGRDPPRPLKTNSPVIAFEAPIGLNSVPYAFALTADRAYLLLENTWISRDSITAADGDPYTSYYK